MITLSKIKKKGKWTRLPIIVSLKLLVQRSSENVLHCKRTELWIYLLIGADMEDLKNFSKSQDTPEADDLNNWDISFWSERLRESKFDINEVLS